MNLNLLSGLIFVLEYLTYRLKLVRKKPENDFCSIKDFRPLRRNRIKKVLDKVLRQKLRFIFGDNIASTVISLVSTGRGWAAGAGDLGGQIREIDFLILLYLHLYFLNLFSPILMMPKWSSHCGFDLHFAVPTPK